MQRCLRLGTKGWGAPAPRPGACVQQPVNFSRSVSWCRVLSACCWYWAAGGCWLSTGRCACGAGGPPSAWRESRGQTQAHPHPWPGCACPGLRERARGLPCWAAGSRCPAGAAPQPRCLHSSVKWGQGQGLYSAACHSGGGGGGGGSITSGSIANTSSCCCLIALRFPQPQPMPALLSFPPASHHPAAPTSLFSCCRCASSSAAAAMSASVDSASDPSSAGHRVGRAGRGGWDIVRGKGSAGSEQQAALLLPSRQH